MMRERNLQQENKYEDQAICRKHVLKCFCLALILLFSIQGFSNNIKGKIQDSKTLESIPFANVLVKNTTNGMMSDSDGNFNLNIEKFPCTIIIKFIGYKSQEVRVENKNQFLNVMLEEDVVALNEITVKPDNSYERSLLRKVIKNRKKNNPDNYQALSYKDYTRTTVFLSNLGVKTSQSKTFRKSADAFVKSSDSTDDAFLYG
ncbi:carboxypeptidase-like regulatory domain-containing protein [Marinifilum fragile]|uniref:carboxypeptidase-like regulatory domain-containing protein n=1 Tax=Marinifilum fragile TaxID=570161 RepID=UPI0006CF23EB|nr:carboxypeptidase-like regulatory domain-containing protein [Marinifilum fragile]